MSDPRSNMFRISPLTGLIMLAIFLFILYLLFRGLMAFATWAMPVLVIATLIMDYKVYLRFIAYIADLFRRNVGLGVLAGLLTVLLFPLVILMLFGQAMASRLLQRAVNENPLFQDPADRGRNAGDDEYVDFEIVEEEELKLPTEREERKKEDNRYDDFF